ncbi:MAG: co-chaperone GroES [Oscillatoriales cyanobacterium C42_A2020_001]|nr:co-chaperone GroES [Leptolyngbyaceae cyanobacterium C42_A2020_001]
MAFITLNSSTVVQPFGDLIFIKVTVPDDKTDGGLFLFRGTSEKPQIGVIAAIGPGRFRKNGSRQKVDVSVGDQVLYSKYMGTEIQLGAEEYILIAEKDVLAIVA